MNTFTASLHSTFIATLLTKGAPAPLGPSRRQPRRDTGEQGGSQTRGWELLAQLRRSGGPGPALLLSYAADGLWARARGEQAQQGTAARGQPSRPAGDGLTAHGRTSRGRQSALAPCLSATARAGDGRTVDERRRHDGLRKRAEDRGWRDRMTA